MKDRDDVRQVIIFGEYFWEFYQKPHLMKLLETGEISYTKIGKHRRIKYQDIIEYKREMKAKQRKLLIEIMKAEGLYDS